MWKLKKEKFLENVSWLTDLNLRFSTGLSGNAGIGGYRHLTTISPNNYYNRQMAYKINEIGNPRLHWEEQRKTTLGLNVVIFRATSFNLEYYDRESYEMLTSRTVNTTMDVNSMLTMLEECVTVEWILLSLQWYIEIRPMTLLYVLTLM